MSELQNPLFDEEKEFLERKKLEYERALLGDVEHIKEQSATVGKVALVGAGLAGTVWLISKAFGGKKRRSKNEHRSDARAKGEGKEKSQSKDKRKSAAASAMVFIDHFEDGDHEFGNNAPRPDAKPQSAPRAAQPVGALVNSTARSTDKMQNVKPVTPVAAPASFASAAAPVSTPAPKAVEKPAAVKFAPAPEAGKPSSTDEDPFQDLPYDDSRRLPASKSFDKEAKGAAKKEAKDEEGVPTPEMAAVPRNSMVRVVGSVLQQFLQSDTGKVLVAQAGALALAAVTKKAGEIFPTAKNADLAASSDAQPADTAAAPAASSAPSASPDAPKSPQSV